MDSVAWRSQIVGYLFGWWAATVLICRQRFHAALQVQPQASQAPGGRLRKRLYLLHFDVKKPQSVIFFLDLTGLRSDKDIPVKLTFRMANYDGALAQRGARSASANAQSLRLLLYILLKL